MTRRIRGAIINVPTKVGADAWERCWHEAADRADIFGINEAFNPHAKRLYRGLARQHGYGQYGTRQTGNPIFWDRDVYRKVSGRVHTIHGSSGGLLARRWPGFNAERQITDVVLRHRDTRQEVAVLNTHWVPNGGRVPSIWRTWARRKSKRLTRKLIRAHLAAGRVVVFMGDTNIREEIGLTKRMVWLRGVGIDKAGIAVPRGMRVRRKRARLFAAPTDHKHGVAFRATVTTTKEKP